MQQLQLTKERRLYIAYGEFMSFSQMSELCPTAEYIGTGNIRHWRLMFQGETDNGRENIIPCHSCNVPVAVWSITIDDEMELDTVYNYRFTYTKCRIGVMYNNQMYTGFTYIINNTLPITTPSQRLKDLLKEGYSDNGIPLTDWDSRFF